MNPSVQICFSWPFWASFPRGEKLKLWLRVGESETPLFDLWAQAWCWSSNCTSAYACRTPCNATKMRFSILPILTRTTTTPQCRPVFFYCTTAQTLLRSEIESNSNWSWKTRKQKNVASQFSSFHDGSELIAQAHLSPFNKRLPWTRARDVCVVFLTLARGEFV